MVEQVNMDSIDCSMKSYKNAVVKRMVLVLLALYLWQFFYFFSHYHLFSNYLGPTGMCLTILFSVLMLL